MFRRRRRADQSTEAESRDAETSDVDTSDVDSEPTVGGAAPGESDRTDGPFDVSEVADPAAGGRVDLGGLWLPARQGMELRVEVDQKTQNVASVAAVVGKSAVQVQAFAAPRREGIWQEIRTEIAAGINGQGGRSEEAEGPFGAELRAQVPVRLPDGTASVQGARFVGVDGPRWFLRGVITGEALADPQAAAPLEDIFRGIVVVRGREAMAPREPIPLLLPQQAQSPGADETGAPGAEPLAPFERGPEITEVR